MKSNNLNILLIIVVIIASRIFFLDTGYGSEEDAWGVALTAKHISLTNTYEASRLPGHPVQEYVYSILGDKSPLTFNAFTCFFSVLACVYFYLILVKLKSQLPILSALLLAFTPVIYIHSSDCMDYLWALCFVLMSYYYLLNERFIWSGIFLGIAVGCRITSAVFIIPFIIQLLPIKKENLIKILKLGITCTIISFVFFIPVMRKYGLGFFHYSDQYPYPNFPKLIFKMSIGLWGSIGTLAVIIFLLMIIKNYFINRKNSSFQSPSWWLIIILFTILYFILPQKSAYLIPIIPFVILLANKFLSSSQFKIFAYSIIVSSFFLGINLADSTRGAESSGISKNISIGNQNINFDLVYGPVLDDYLKRKSRMKFTNEILDKIHLINDENERSIIISGWWMNPILVGMDPELIHPKVKFEERKVEIVYTMDEPEMMEKLDHGFSIYYLPEMDSVNDLRYKINSTKILAQPLFGN